MASADYGFRQALAHFTSRLTDDERLNFKFTKLEEVREAVIRIQQEQASRTAMMNLTRIQSFLEAMEQYGKVIEVFLNSSEFLPFIWGPLKLMLQVRTSLLIHVS
jgi:hypothetical protein